MISYSCALRADTSVESIDRRDVPSFPHPQQVLSDNTMAVQELGDRASAYKPWRLRFMAIMLLLGFVAVLAKLFVVQIIHGAEYRERARKQYEARVDLRPTRGMIFDRNQHVIASTIQSVSYAVDPKMLENPDRVCELLSQVCGQTKAQLMAKIQANKDKNFLWIARGFNVGSATAALDTLSDAGFIRLSEPKRNYLYGSMAAQVVGCTNVDNKGLAGLELAYDSLLQGESGFEVMQRDGRGRMQQVVGASNKPARNGYSLELTIDAELQSIVEQELQRGMESAGAQSAMAVALNPHTGEILSMASCPSYNPNDIRQATPEAMRIRAICDMYEPGSTFKMITAATAFDNNLATPDSPVDGLGGILTLKDGTEVRDHEALGACSLTTALEKSSNIIFGSLARSIPDAIFYKYTRDFGFGIPIGFDLSGEARGILKMPKDYDATTKLFMGFGYQLATTALQLANAYATVANNGQMMKPYIVRAILDQHNAVVKEFQPQRIRQVIAPQTAQTLSSMFCCVVDRGTGTEAHIDGLRIAGKTGTAQQLVDGKYSKQAYTASFIGYFPADSAEMVLLIMLDRPKTDIYGGRTAAPIFRNIVQRILSTPSVSANFPGLAHLAVKATPSDTVRVPDIRGMRWQEADALMRDKGLRIGSADNSAIIARQDPAPGSSVIRGSAVSIECGAPLRTNQQDSVRQRDAAHPDVRGLSLRRAIAILQSHSIQVRVHGSGRVRSQSWSTLNKKPLCTLQCSD